MSDHHAPPRPPAGRARPRADSQPARYPRAPLKATTHIAPAPRRTEPRPPPRPAGRPCPPTGDPPAAPQPPTMAFAVSRKALAVSAVATPSGKRVNASRVVPRAAINDGAAKMFRETGADAPAAGATAPVQTPFDNYRFAPIREATVSAAPTRP